MIYVLIILLYNSHITIQSNLHGFDDSVLYTINWIDAAEDLVHTQEAKNGNGYNFEEIVVQTDANEKYKCKIPHVVDKESDANEKYSGPSALELISERFSQLSPCAYRLEPFWTYELCHGRFIRQYHEEREGKTVKLQEYFLGRWDKSGQEKLHASLEVELNKGASVPVKKIGGLNMPYFQINMTDGTMCDLNGKPRLTNVLYVCYAQGKHDIYSLKETSICEYEVIVLSPLLCTHPNYRPQSTGETPVNCMPIDNAKRMPKSLLQLEAENAKLQHQNFRSIPRVRLELLPLDDNIGTENAPQSHLITTKGHSSAISSEFQNFIDGNECIQGGSGWWKYELCYGKSVIQFHTEKDGSRTVVNLGNFVKSGHLKWLKSNPHKRPVIGSHISYLYTMGSICDATGLPRQTEVKLKCVDNKSNPGSVSLYLLEPRTCQYILGVESRVVCRLLEQVDEDGILTTDHYIGFTRSEYSSGYMHPAQPHEPNQANSKSTRKDVKIMVVLEDEDNHIADGDE